MTGVCAASGVNGVDGESPVGLHWEKACSKGFKLLQFEAPFGINASPPILPSNGGVVGSIVSRQEGGSSEPYWGLRGKSLMIRL